MTPDPRMIGRLQLTLTEEQAFSWAARIEGQVQIDPQRRGARYWGLFLGLSGRNLDRVLLELGEAPAPRGRVPILNPRSYHRRLHEGC